TRPHLVFMSEHPSFDYVLARTLQMPQADQLEFLTSLLAFLREGSGVEPRIDVEIQRKVEAVAELREVAAVLGMSPGELRVQRCDWHWRATGSPWRSGRVIKAFGRWSNAVAAASGAHVPGTPGQRALARAATGRIGRTEEEYVEGVHLW